jgi:hypothetical protein
MWWPEIMSPKDMLRQTFLKVLRAEIRVPDKVSVAIAYEPPQPLDDRETWGDRYRAYQESVVQSAGDSLLAGGVTSKPRDVIATDEYQDLKATLGQVYDIRDDKTFLVFEIRRDA